MAEQYVRKQWINGEVITATALNNMENGIENLMGATAGINSTIKSQELQIGDTPNSISALGGNLRVDNKTTTGELAAGNAAFSGAVKVEGSGASLTVPTPSDNMHAVTKMYVDNNFVSQTTAINAGQGLSGGGTLGQNRELSLNVATTEALGGIKVGSGLAINNGTLSTNIANANANNAGLMTAAHFKKLDGLSIKTTNTNAVTPTDNGLITLSNVVDGIKINGYIKESSNGVVNIGDNIVTSITMNGNALTITNGAVNLGTVITAHQDISTKADKTNPVFTGTIKLGSAELTEDKLLQLLALVENNGGE